MLSRYRAAYAPPGALAFSAAGFVARLAIGDATVNELAAPIAMSLPGISKHLKVLERSGLITRSRSAQFRPCHLEVATLDSTMEWIAKQRELWSDRFEKLDQHLQAIQQAAPAGHGESDHV